MNPQALRTQEKESLRHARVAAPLVDVFENADEVLIVCELPGVAKDKLTLHLTDSTLTLEAQPPDFPPERGTVLTHERAYAAFERKFSLPEGIAADRISAEIKDGVARVRLPKADKAKPRQIPIR
jgi:HSP20 family molecular chaperone IbpA